MTLDEAKLVAEVISHADGDCSNCVHNLVNKCNAKFPNFVFTYTDTNIIDYDAPWFDWYKNGTGIIVTVELRK